MNLFARNRDRTPDPAAAPAGPEPALPKSQLMVTQVLSGIANVLAEDAADRIFDRPSSVFARRDEIRDELGNPDYRLRQALEDHTQPDLAELETSRRGAPRPLVFNDVIVWINQEIWENDHESGGIYTRQLTRRLEAMHTAAFRRDLWQKGRKVSYVCVPHPGLRRDQGMIGFGRAVFVPSAADRLIGSVTIEKVVNGDRAKLKRMPSWSFHEIGRSNRMVLCQRAIGVYDEQLYLLLGQDLNEAPILPDLWFDHGQGRILIDLEGQTGSGDGRVIRRHVEAQQDQSDPKLLHWTFEAVEPPSRPGAQEQLVVSVQFDTARADTVGAGPAAAGAASRWAGLRARRPADMPQVDPIPRRRRDAPAAPPEPRAADTVVTQPGPTCLTISLDDYTRIDEPSGDGRPAPCRLEATGIALPRIDRRASPVNKWHLRIAADGSLEPGTGAPAGRCVHLAGFNDEPGLWVAGAGKNDWTPINPEAGEPAMIVGVPLVFLPLPAELRERYHAILRLPTPVPVAVQPGIEHTLGREGPGDPTVRKIQFGLLTQPESLAHDEVPGASIEQLNLSRNHLRAVVDEDGLRVTMQDGRSPVWRLDGGHRLVATLVPGSADALVLAPGDFLLMGCYLVRFQRQDAPAEPAEIAA